jgi:hypothetical protein
MSSSFPLKNRFITPSPLSQPKYKGLVDPITKKPMYSEDIIEKMVYAGSKVMDYNKRIPDVNSKLIGAGILNTQEIVNKVMVTARKSCLSFIVKIYTQR